MMLISLLLAAQPVELGTVHFLRSFDEALAQARALNKPILVLFDEVPGCSTVRGFGKEVLSDASVVEMIEDHFVAVAIFNNTGGEDLKVLQQFQEPAWNNPVVRILDSTQRPIAPRFDGPYDLTSFKNYLQSATASAPTRDSKVTFAVPCFWECEAQFGKILGITSTRVGFSHGHEVVEVQFNPSVVSKESLLSRARETNCSSQVFGADESIRYSESDTKYYLKKSKYFRADASEAEQIKVNAALRFGENIEAAKASCRANRR
jgi:Thioredoxin-like